MLISDCTFSTSVGIYLSYRFRSLHNHAKNYLELSVEEHRALKLLTILEGKKLGAVLKEAINSYLLQKGAHDLEVKGKQ